MVKHAERGMTVVKKEVLTDPKRQAYRLSCTAKQEASGSAWSGLGGRKREGKLGQNPLL